MSERPEIIQARYDKLSKLQELNITAFAYKFHRTHLSAEIKDKYTELEGSGEKVRVAGRLMAIRGHGKSSFGHIWDNDGKIQFYIKYDIVGEEQYNFFKKLLDIGDIIGIEGEVFKTKTGEITVKVEKIEILSKSLLPLPEKWHGLVDKEARYRQRYLDLISNPKVKEIFIKRTKMYKAFRAFLDSQGFLEVETPILQPIYGGAFAKPFQTHLNALDLRMYLRIADELYLKRLIIGGFEKVYEICKDFRNEGVDRLHNPEFTQIELYSAYWDYRDMMDFTERMLEFVAGEVCGTTEIEYEGRAISFKAPFKRVSMLEVTAEKTGVDFRGMDYAEAKKYAESLGVDVGGKRNWGQVVEEVFSELVQADLVQPTFITDFPADISPLAKPHRDKPGLSERFEGYIAGEEVFNAFSELNDPIIQREKFAELQKLRRLGDEEAPPIDEDFLTAMEYGMPPTAGLGCGLDRLIMILTDSHSIREVIFFPLMKPEEK